MIWIASVIGETLKGIRSWTELRTPRVFQTIQSLQSLSRSQWLISENPTCIMAQKNTASCWATYPNMSWAWVTFPLLQAWFANGVTSLLPWFLWSKATAIKPTLPAWDGRWFQSWMHVFAILAIPIFVCSRGCRSHRHDIDLQAEGSSSSP